MKFKVGDHFSYKGMVYTVSSIDFYLGSFHFFGYRWEGSTYHFGHFFEKEMKPVKNCYEQLTLF